MTQKYYKLVSDVWGKSKDPNKSVFISWSTFSEPLRVEYQIGHKTFPQVPGTPLFVFSDLEYCKDRVGTILECEIGPIISGTGMYDPGQVERLTPKELQNFWKNPYKSVLLDVLIPGTILTEWVLPTAIYKVNKE